MLTELQRRKYTANFNLYDVDGNGTVERDDFERVAARWAQNCEVEPGSPEYEQAYGTIMGIWGFVQHMSGNGSDRVTMADWMTAAENVVGASDDRAMVERSYHEPARALFRLMDRNNDGQISEDEYGTFLDAFGVEGEDARLAFERLDRDGDGFIDDEEWVANVVEFYFSDEAEAPGNWYIGPF